jgi:hypothetical protein
MLAPVSLSFANARLTGPRLRACLYALTVLAYLAVKPGHVAAMAPALSVLALLSILVSLPACGPPATALVVLLFGSGSWMLWHSGAGWSEFLGAHGDMAYLLALFAVLPVLSEPIKLGGYGKAIQALMGGRVGSMFRLNCLVTGLAFVCGSFMSLASIPVMMAAMTPVLNNYPIDNKVRFMVVSAISGYVLPMMWTPVSGVVGAVLYNLRLDWVSMFPTLLALSIACLAANWLVFHLIESRRELPLAPAARADEPADAASPLPRMMQILLAIVVLVISIALLEQWLQVGTITVVTLVAIPFAFAWCAAIGQGRQFVREASAQLASRLPRMADQFAIFLSGGFFVSAMRLSGFDQTANLLLLDFHHLVGTNLLLTLMPVLTLGMSFLGVHPLVAIVLFGQSLKPEVLGITPDKIALTLVGSCVLTFMQGPFSGTLGLVQSLTGTSSFRLARWTAPYALAYFVVLVIVIWLM